MTDLFIQRIFGIVGIQYLKTLVWKNHMLPEVTETFNLLSAKAFENHVQAGGGGGWS